MLSLGDARVPFYVFVRHAIHTRFTYMRLNILLSRSNCRRETKYLEKKTHIKVKYYTTGIIPCYMSFRYMKKYN